MIKHIFFFTELFHNKPCEKSVSKHFDEDFESYFTKSFNEHHKNLQNGSAEPRKMENNNSKIHHKMFPFSSLTQLHCLPSLPNVRVPSY